MKSRFLLVCSLFLLFGASLVSAQGDTSCPVVTLFNGWAASSPAGAPNGVVYGLLTNLSDQPDTLVSASTDAAEAVELHQTVIGTGDVMQMQPVEGGITIAAQSYQELKSGGLHIMLINLKRALVAGERLSLTLNFEHMGDVTMDVPVKDANETGSSMGDMGSGTPEGMNSMAVEATPAAMTVWPEGCAKVHVVGAWARPAGPGMPNSAAYGLLVNLTGAEETLLNANTSAASTAELHEMVMGTGDVMRMTPIEGGIVIPADGAVVLQPGGKHMMLIGLTQELTSGTTIDLTLGFAHNGELKLTVPVHEPVDCSMPMGATPQGSS